MFHLTDRAWVDYLFRQHDDYPVAPSSGASKRNFVHHTLLPIEDWRQQMAPGTR